MIRSLAPGEPLPSTAPRRYYNAQGYVRLRWRDGDGYVECYEHRAVMGNPAGVHVHHRNGIRDDNRPENLEALDAALHLGQHYDDRRIDDALAAELYLDGMTTTAVGERLGVTATTITRSLQRSGVPTRSRLEHFDTIADVPEILRMFDEEGIGAVLIARRLGLGPPTVRRILDREGRDRSAPRRHMRRAEANR
jgi:transcriptional regulator with XRE-family HTH domain